MSRSRRGRSGAAFLTLAAGFCGMAQGVDAAERRLFLDVSVNGRSVGLVAEFLDRDGRIFASPAELRAVGIAAPAGPDSAPIPLASLPGLRHELDERGQRISFVAADAARTVAEYQAQDRAEPLAAESAFGALLNYDILATANGGRAAGAGLAELRAFSPYGSLSVDLAGYTPGAGYREQIVRLGTAFAHDDPDSLRRYRVGDFVNVGLGWSRPVRLGGVQVASDFGLRPDLITFPVPTASGSAAVPSTVDVLVNGVRQFSSAVEPGPFSVRQLPVVTGAGEVAVVVRDALGRETTNTLPFYATGALLAPGLASYGAEFGWVRRGFGLVSDDYREAAASGTLRYGLSRRFTAEAHAEATNRLAMGGGGLAMAIAPFGVVSGSAAASTGVEGSGGLLSLGFERIGRPVSVSGSVTLASAGFRDIAAMAGDPVPRRAFRGSLGLSLGGFGSLGLAYVGVERGGRRPNIDTAVLASLRNDVSLVSATYSRPIFASATFYATGFHSLERYGGTGAVAGVTFAIGARGSGGATVGRERGGMAATADIAQAATLPGEFGGRATVSQGERPRELAEAEYRGRRARISGGMDRSEGRTAARAGVQGSAVLAAGGLFLSTPVQDSFAVVDTGGQPGIGVLQENRPVGRTDSSGRLLVPNLRSYDRNLIAIDPADVPADATVEATSRTVRPRRRSGVVVGFSVERGASARIRLVRPDGSPVPMGSAAGLAGNGSGGGPAPVGHDGETFLTGLAAKNVVAVRLPDGTRCEARFAFKAEPGALPLLGPLPCS